MTLDAPLIDRGLSSAEPRCCWCCGPSQTVVYGISTLCFCIACVWGLRCLSEITVPWLVPSPQFTVAQCLLYAVWCLTTLIPCIAYLYAAEAIWAAASDLNAKVALQARKAVWGAFAAAALKLAIVLHITALSEEARDPNPYVLLETQIFMLMIIGSIVALLAVTWGMVRMLRVFAKECDSPQTACLA